MARWRIVFWSAGNQLLWMVFHCVRFLSSLRTLLQGPSCLAVAARLSELLACTDCVLRSVRVWKSFDFQGESISACRDRRFGKTLGHHEHSYGVHGGLNSGDGTGCFRGVAAAGSARSRIIL